MMKSGWLAALGAALVLSGCVAPAAFGPIAVPEGYGVEEPNVENREDAHERLMELQDPIPEPYLITSQDEFALSVYEQPELTAQRVVVTPDGFVSLPLIGQVQVGGLSLQAATDKISKCYETYLRHPKVALIPLNIHGYSFTVVGAVAQNGCYPIAQGKTRLVDGIAMARGFSQGTIQGNTISFANLDTSYIARKGEILPVSFVEAFVKGNPMHNIPLVNGDYIYIPESTTQSVVLLGEVRSPTYVNYKEGLTVLHALPLASGLLETHSCDAKVIRGNLQNPVVFTINVDHMLEGKIRDFPLKPGDIIYFPADGVSEWNVMVRKIIPSLQALSMLAGPFGNPAGALAE